jgi:hypothetical protein
MGRKRNHRRKVSRRRLKKRWADAVAQKKRSRRMALHRQLRLEAYPRIVSNISAPPAADLAMVAVVALVAMVAAMGVDSGVEGSAVVMDSGAEGSAEVVDSGVEASAVSLGVVVASAAGGRPMVAVKGEERQAW